MSVSFLAPLVTPPRTPSLGLVVFLVLTGAVVPDAQAQMPPQAPVVGEEDVHVPKMKPTLTVTSAASAIIVDGQLGEEAWDRAARFSGFTEIQPGDEVRPPVETEVLVTYDATSLYVAFIAYDDPERVRASLRERDDIFQDDWVGIIVDPYGDGVQAYEIFANPLGIQGDLFMQASGNEDIGFDLIYHSEGEITDDGYRVEMAIPFSSLRFPDRAEHAWNITFLRSHPRSSRGVYSWATVSRDDPCLLCQMGTIEGIQGITPGTNIDVLPAVVGVQRASRKEAGGLDNGRLRLEPSVNLQYSFTPSLTGEATVNPDFSQVESDAAQIDVNTTFALSFPERRPFFQEGSGLFETWLDAVYTRSINDPIGAAKLTGRAGRTSMAFLSAVDEHTPLLIPFEERSELAEAGRSVSNILRARRSFGENSFVGGTLTDRRLVDGGSGSLVSGDLQYQFLTNYRIEAQLALSHTQELEDADLSEAIGAGTFDRGTHSAALDGERFSGWASYVSLERSGRHWNFDFDYWGHSPTFRAANGFITRNDYHRFVASQSVDLYPKWSFAEILTTGAFVQRTLNFDGVEKSAEVGGRFYGRLKRQTFFFTTFSIEREQFQDVAFDGLYNAGVEVNSRFSEPLSASFYLYGGRGIYREDLVEGQRVNAGASLTIKPLQRLVFETGMNYARMRDPETGESFFEGFILRTRSSLQFTRELSLRLVVQYDDFDETLAVEPLLAYRINAFSTFYVGSTHGLDRFDYQNDRRFEQSARQFFFKFQYLFQM